MCKQMIWLHNNIKELCRACAEMTDEQEIRKTSIVGYLPNEEMWSEFGHVTNANWTMTGSIDGSMAIHECFYVFQIFVQLICVHV